MQQNIAMKFAEYALNPPL